MNPVSTQANNVIEQLKKIHPNCTIENISEETTYDGFGEYGPELENRTLNITLYDNNMVINRVYDYSHVIGTDYPDEYILLKHTWYYR